MWKKRILVPVIIGILLSACSQNKNREVITETAPNYELSYGEYKEVITETAQKYEAMSYGEYKLETGNEVEFYHGNYFIGEIPDSSLCTIYCGEYDEDIAFPVLNDDTVPLRVQGALDNLINGIEKETSLVEFVENLSADSGKTASCEILEGGGTAYYVGNIYALIQFDSDKDGKYDRQLSISMDESENETVAPESIAWLEMI